MIRFLTGRDCKAGGAECFFDPREVAAVRPCMVGGDEEPMAEILLRGGRKLVIEGEARIISERILAAQLGLIGPGTEPEKPGEAPEPRILRALTAAAPILPPNTVGVVSRAMLDARRFRQIKSEAWLLDAWLAKVGPSFLIGPHENFAEALVRYLESQPCPPAEGEEAETGGR